MKKTDELLLKIRSYYNFEDNLINDLKDFEKIFEENPAILLYSPNYIYYVSLKLKVFKEKIDYARRKV